MLAILLYNALLFTGLIYFSYKTYKAASNEAEMSDNVTMYVNKYGELYESETQLINK